MRRSRHPQKNEPRLAGARLTCCLLTSTFFLFAHGSIYSGQPGLTSVTGSHNSLLAKRSISAASPPASKTAISSSRTERGEYVLTIFEKLSFEQLPFYLKLMRHLAEHGVLVPAPVANRSRRTARHAARQAGRDRQQAGRPSQMAPQPVHCAAVGAMLAKMHLAARDFPLHQPNLRGLAWWHETAPAVLPFLTPTSGSSCCAPKSHYQEAFAATSLYHALPNAARCTPTCSATTSCSTATRLTGFFDFYFAGCDTWLFDVAVTVNDWCIDQDSGALDLPRVRAHAGRLPCGASVHRRRAATPGSRCCAPARCASGCRACTTSICRATPRC